jgi:hypothetical protein
MDPPHGYGVRICWAGVGIGVKLNLDNARADASWMLTTAERARLGVLGLLDSQQL